MAQRTTIAKVKLELTGDYDSRKNPSLQPFIGHATVITDRVVACALAKGITLTTEDGTNDSEATQIETLLAAHFYKYARDRQLASKSTGGASGSYSGQTAMSLNGTTYGQNAMSVDYSGCLQAIALGADKKVARGAWLGKRPSEQTAYVDRD